MFGNLIFFIAAILIASTYQPVNASPTPSQTLMALVAIYTVYYLAVKLVATGLRKKLNNVPLGDALKKYEKIKLQCAFIAIIAFSYFIYGLNLAVFLPDIPLLALFPTLGHLILITFFAGFLILAWTALFPLHKQIIHPDYSRQEYIKSNFAFPVSGVVPWCIISLLSDATRLLPPGKTEAFLNTAFGEITFLFVTIVVVLALVPLIVPKIWGCQPINNSFIQHRVDAVSHKSGVRLSKALLWPLFGGSMITAAVLGIFPGLRYILVTPALIQYLSPEEFDAVISHEIGHIKKKHVIVYFMVLSCFGFFVYGLIELLMIPFAFILGAGMTLPLSDSVSTPVLLSFLSLAGAGLFIPFFRYGFGYIMRNCERQADAFSYTITKSGKDMIATFYKIAALNQIPLDKPSWHHYSIGERIAFMEACDNNPSLPARHDRKVRKIIGFYMLIVFSFTAFVLAGTQSDSGKQLKTSLFESGLLHAINKEPENHQNYTAAADFYYSDRQYKKAADYYRQSLHHNGRDAYTLNNLAWLLATTNDKTVFNPQEALTYARKAASIEQSPHILDTLAECYYANGQRDKAIQASKKALNRASVPNKAYYKKQLQRFMTP